MLLLYVLVFFFLVNHKPTQVGGDSFQSALKIRV